MRLWAICGYDELYGGLYGMKEMAIYEGTENDAKEYANELADDVINSYSCIYSSLEESIRQECEAEGIEIDSIEEDEIRSEIYGSDIIYDCIELDINKLPTLDIEKLEEMYDNDEDGFIEAYRLD